MKKTLIALAVLGSFTTLAIADSSVTLYGLIDESVIVQKAGSGDSAKASVTSGFTAGSRWGIRGVEDLGGGNAVGFILEETFNIDTGNGNSRQFQRESALYVKGGWGQFTAGRLGTLGFAQSTNILRGAIFGTTYGAWGWNSTQGQNFGRVDNAVAYKSPDFGGITVHAMYSNKIDGVATDDWGHTDDSSGKWSENSHYYGLGFLYSGGDLQASLILEANDEKDAWKTYDKALYHATIGGQWKLGMITPMAIYQYAWGAYKQHNVQIGANVDCAGGVFTIGGKYIARSGDESLGDRDSANLWNVGVAYTYPLSKRTKVYGFGGYTDGGKAWDQGSYKTNTTYNGYAVGVGMVHNF